MSKKIKDIVLTIAINILILGVIIIVVAIARAC